MGRRPGERMGPRRPARWPVSLGPVLGIALLCGCETTHVIRPSPLELLTPSVLEQVRAAPDSLQVLGRTLRLATYLWRDYMPVAPPGGDPLRALMRITTTDGSEFPHELWADAAWVIHGAALWATWSPTFSVP